MNSKNDPPRSVWLPKVRLTPAELERIRAKYGPNDMSANIRARLLQTGPGRPRRVVKEIPPDVAVGIQRCLVALEAIRGALKSNMPAVKLGIVLLTLTSIEDNLIQILNAPKISADDDSVHAKRS